MEKTLKPTETELEILQILWASGAEQSVRFVVDRLNERREVGYTTALKMMQIMLEKGLLTRREQDRQHLYRPAIDESATKTQLVERLAQGAFGGSAARLVLSALGTKNATAAELAEIKKFIADLEGKN